MNNKKKHLLLFLLLMNTIGFSQDRKLELEIGHKSYETLYLRAHQLQGNPIQIVGESADNSQWTFVVPDSIVTKAIYFTFRGKILPTSPNENHIGFLDVIDGDSLVGREINFNENETVIQLKINYSHTTHEVNNQYIPALKKTVKLQEWDADYFTIDASQNLFLKANMIDPSWGFFQDTKRYDEILAEYASKIKRNPNSSYYMNRLALTPNFYKNKKDIANLYYLFSKEMQDSYFGKIVYNNFSTFSISNVALKNCETGIEEGIVADFDKYTLLIFSASWCGPCHKKIPLLKDIYNKMGDNLNMVYITTDEEKYLPQWKKLMSKEKIPWRSLSFNQALKEAWNIKAIPDYILIDTHWNARKINLNEQEDLDNLYSIISSK